MRVFRSTGTLFCQTRARGTKSGPIYGKSDRLASAVNDVTTGGHSHDRPRKNAGILDTFIPDPQEGVNVAFYRRLCTSDYLTQIIDGVGYA